MGNECNDLGKRLGVNICIFYSIHACVCLDPLQMHCIGSQTCRFLRVRFPRQSLLTKLFLCTKAQTTGGYIFVDGHKQTVFWRNKGLQGRKVCVRHHILTQMQQQPMIVTYSPSETLYSWAFYPQLPHYTAGSQTGLAWRGVRVNKAMCSAAPGGVWGAQRTSMCISKRR